MVLASQGVGHHTDQLLPGSLAFRSEVLAEVGGQDDDEDVTQELWRWEDPLLAVPRSQPLSVPVLAPAPGKPT